MNFIDVDIIGNEFFGVGQPLFQFTFMADPYDELDPQLRFDAMCAMIRNTLVNHYLFGLDELHTFIVEFFPPHYEQYARQRTFGRIGTITSDIFMALYSGMLHSDETILVDGMRITVQLIGNDMNHQIIGAGRTFGAKAIPQHLKSRGLITHCWADVKKESVKETGLCGFLAILLLHDEKYVKKSQFWDWLKDAKQIGRQLGITDGMCKNEHFETFLQSDPFKKHRIVIFSINRTIEFIASGPEW